MTITPREQDVLDVIMSYYLEHNQAPTLDEIAEVLAIAKPTVHGHCVMLVAKKYLRNAKGKWRSYRPIGAPCRVCKGTGIEKVKE